ncbi:MAG: signal recognition particle-docking protein FtsY [Myxococcaceae bacterium]|nr:signal recognition particle-docking protein FtsY [Myxococcaceae bacterium]MCA3014150.1 signal recognition particle-docking protein FtsY [Myxococcaceae bacterium]
MLLADVQAVPPSPADPVGTVIAVVLGLGLVVLLGLVARKLVSKPRATTVAPPALPRSSGVEPALEAKPLPKVELPPSEVEAKAKAEAEARRAEAERLKAERAALEQGSAEAQALKAQEEALKKDAYRAQKQAEAEEKERKKREREEAERLALEEKKRAEEAAAEAKRQAEALERAKIEAQAGATLAAGLAKTKREGFMAKLNGLFGGAPKVIDEKVLGELEEVLFTADIGVRTASRLVELAREKAKSKELDSAEKLKGVIRREVEQIVSLKANTSLAGGGPPHVIMVVGVNGAGKTTTIGKLASKAKAEGKKVVVGAGDTFRAAAAEQLDVWAARAGAELVKGKDEADPASVVFDAIKRAKDVGADLVLADTAGRLHTKANLMEELKKVKRVAEKALPGAPHEVLLVLDSTMGQNAIAQAKEFKDAVGVTSIALTKLDGTAKGGVIIGICDELKLPVAWAGVGEKVADLRQFDAKEFVDALFE